MIYYASKVTEELKAGQHLVIFGAGLVAYEVASCLMRKPYQLKIDSFLVSERKENPKELLGLPVVALKEQEYVVNQDAVIVVAVMEKHLSSICENLHRHGYFHIIPLTFESDQWSLVQGNYYREFRLACHKEYRTLEEELQQVHRGRVEMDGSEEEKKKKREKSSVHIYMARCHVDRQLEEDLSRYYWEIPIQVGAVLTRQQICEVRDDWGENISYKNQQYCELTALYWIWKNDCSDYAGLCHYRRHFELDEEMMNRLAVSDIDVVLTIPILNFPDVGKVYQHDHVGRDWEVMMEAVQILAPDYMETAREVQDGNFYYGYNMFIARKWILDDYCAWLFPILQYCEYHCEAKEDGYQGRYIGFLAERLMGIYFLHHEDTYKIVHVRKHFVER